MTLQTLQMDLVAARKAGDKTQVTVLSNMIDAVQKASMTPKGRLEITEQLVNETLIKYQKTVQEQYDSCPVTAIDPERAAQLKQRKEDYFAELSLVKKYAPQLLVDAAIIRDAILSEIGDIPLLKSNRGQIMKIIAPKFKGKADMSVVTRVVGDMLS